LLRLHCGTSAENWQVFQFYAREIAKLLSAGSGSDKKTFSKMVLQDLTGKLPGLLIEHFVPVETCSSSPAINRWAIIESPYRDVTFDPPISLSHPPYILKNLKKYAILLAF